MTAFYACHPTFIYVAQKGNTAANTAAILKSCHFFSAVFWAFFRHFWDFFGVFEPYSGLKLLIYVFFEDMFFRKNDEFPIP